MSETRPRRATIMVSLAALAAGAAIAGGATILNEASAKNGALDVPLVMGYNDANNGVRQTDSGRPTNPATALSGPAAPNSATSSSSSSSAASSSSTTTTSSSTSAEAPPPPPPPPPPPEPTKAAPSGDPNASEAAKVVALVNQVRPGCDPITVDSRLTAAAQGHSTDMATRNYFDHDSPEGVTFGQRIRAAGYSKPGAENIAQGQRSAEQVMQAWMQSPGHRANIVNCEYQTIGVAVDTDGWYWTQDFGF